MRGQLENQLRGSTVAHFFGVCVNDALLLPPRWPLPSAASPGSPSPPTGKNHHLPPTGSYFSSAELRPYFCKGRPHFEGGRPVGGPSAMVAARSETAGRPSGRPILEGGCPLFSGGPPELGQRAAGPFGGWAAPVAAGRPAHQLGPIRPLTAHRFLYFITHHAPSG